MPDTSTGAMTLRLIEALETSARVNVEVQGQIKGVERELAALRVDQAREFGDVSSTFDRQLDDLEDEMKSMNSHLDNLVRETVVTNQLLREDMDSRQSALDHALGIEKEEREWRRTQENRRLDRSDLIADDTRNAVKRSVDEAWSVLKQPFGYLTAGVIFWVLINWFSVSPQQLTPMLSPQAPIQVEAAAP
jgi:hypothetical protein